MVNGGKLQIERQIRLPFTVYYLPKALHLPLLVVSFEHLWSKANQWYWVEEVQESKDLF
jgi:hypothetical protein